MDAIGGGRGVVAFDTAIGVIAYEAGIDVRIIDARGLADPIVSRLRDNAGPDAMPGHEKDLPLDHAQARVGRPAAFAGDDVRRAEPLYRCVPVAELLDAVQAPLTPVRVLRNITGAVGRTRPQITLDGSGSDQPCPLASGSIP